jgi:hypothetical protein
MRLTYTITKFSKDSLVIFGKSFVIMVLLLTLTLLLNKKGKNITKNICLVRIVVYDEFHPKWT